MPTTPLLDTAQLLERLEDDKELLEEIFTVFIGEAPERRTKIKAALQGMDMDRMVQLAHSLKGASGTLGAEPLRQASSALETAARAKDAGAVAANAVRVLDLLARTVEFMAGVEVASL